MKTKRCTTCKDLKPVVDFHVDNRLERKNQCSSKCKSCRSANYRKKYSNSCSLCEMSFAKLDRNKVCRKCNAEAGLLQCIACGHLLAMFLEFTDGKTICRTCLNARRREKTLASQQQVKLESPSEQLGLAEEAAHEKEERHPQTLAQNCVHTMHVEHEPSQHGQ
jgi:hypothetical protein